MAVTENLTDGERGRILVMDDEEGIRILAEAMLEDMGFEVEVTRNGDEAVLFFRREREAGRPFDIVLLDLKIPGGMGGEEAVKKLLEIDPAVKAIVSSGLANTPITNEFRKYGFSGVLLKPYSRKDLLEILTGVLAGPAGVEAQQSKPGI
jgi:two-component system cell cycle sensor histidine kinase/response regulator CckA